MTSVKIEVSVLLLYLVDYNRFDSVKNVSGMLCFESALYLHIKTKNICNGQTATGVSENRSWQELKSFKVVLKLNGLCVKDVTGMIQLFVVSQNCYGLCEKRLNLEFKSLLIYCVCCKLC